MSTKQTNFKYIDEESIQEAKEQSHVDLRPRIPEYNDLMQNIEFAVQNILQGQKKQNSCRKHLNVDTIESFQENCNKSSILNTPKYHDLMHNIEVEVREALH